VRQVVGGGMAEVGQNACDQGEKCCQSFEASGGSRDPAAPPVEPALPARSLRTEPQVVRGGSRRRNRVTQKAQPGPVG